MTINQFYPALAPITRMFAPGSPEWHNAALMVEVYESHWDDLAEMAFGDPAAYGILKGQAERLAAITQHCGSVHGWTLAQHHRLYAEGHRLLGQNTEFLRPTWTENP